MARKSSGHNESPVMGAEALLKALFPDAECTSRQEGVYSKYKIKLGGWPTRYLHKPKKRGDWFSDWHQSETAAWNDALRFVRSMFRDLED